MNKKKQKNFADLGQGQAAVSAVFWRGGLWHEGVRSLPEETPVVLTYDRSSFAVMMATPLDLADFALGFSLSEGIISAAADVTGLEIVSLPEGMECRMTLASGKREALQARRRHVAGPLGCGLCGIDSLREALRPLPVVTSALQVTPAAIAECLARLEALQVLNQATRAVHAAAFFSPATGEILLREDVGRHNALDKTIGAVMARGLAAHEGIMAVTSRVSIELIQKTAILGAPILAAISVPTARAVREAEAAGITLIGVARGDAFEVFSHRERIMG